MPYIYLKGAPPIGAIIAGLALGALILMVLAPYDFTYFSKRSKKAQHLSVCSMLSTQRV